MTTLFLVELTFGDIQPSELEEVANRIKAAIEESITPFETSLKGYTIVNKSGDAFYSVGKSEQKKLWDTKPKTGIAWLKQAKEFGYGWSYLPFTGCRRRKYCGW